MLKKYVYMVALSEFGSRMNFMAMTAILLSFPDSIWYLTVFFLARQIAGIIASPVAGYFADRVDRRKLMIGSDLAGGAAVLLPVFFHSPWAPVVTAFLLGCTYQFFYISYSSAIPDMFGENNALSVNALIVRLGSAVGILGFLAGGWITELLGYAPVIIFDSLTFFVGAAILSRLKWENSSPPGNMKKEKHGAIPYLYLLKPGSFPGIIIATGLFYSLAVAGYNFSLPILADGFKHQAAMNGFFWASVSIGMFGGSLIKKARPTTSAYLAALFLFSISISTAFLFNNPLFICLALAMAGMFEGMGQVNAATLLQKASGNIRGKLFGLQGLSSRIGFLIGFMASPGLLGLSGKGGPVWIFAGLLAAMVSLLAGWTWKKGREGS